MDDFLNKIAILDTIPDIVVQVNLDKVYVWGNPAAIGFFGIDMIGQPASNFFVGSQDTYLKVSPIFAGSEEVIYLESWQKRVDGQIRLLAWWCRNLKNSDGRTIGAISTARDITEQKQVEQLLRENERRLKKAQSAAHVGNWELDLETNVIWASDEAYQIYGLEKNDHLPLITVQNSVLPEYRTLLDQALHDLISTGKKYDVEFRIKNKKDDTVRYIHSQAELYKNESGKPIKVLGIIQDITDYQTTGENLKASQLILQNIIDLLPVRIFWKDLKLNYLGCNKAFAQDAGKNTPEELIGKDDYQMGWKQQADLYRNDDQKVIDSGQPKLNYVEPQVTPDGKTIWLNSNKVPLLDNNGKIKGVLGTYIDITSSKLADDELKDKNEDLQKMNQAMVDREIKMVELKEKISLLESRLGHS